MKRLFPRALSENWGSESGGASFVTILLLIPLLLACFGLAVDVSKGNYMKESIQGNLSSSVNASVSELNTNRATINSKAAKQTAREQYAINRASYDGGVVGNWKLNSFSVTNGGRTANMTVTEKVPNVFLHMVGIDHFNIKVSASATVSHN